MSILTIYLYFLIWHINNVETKNRKIYISIEKNMKHESTWAYYSML